VADKGHSLCATRVVDGGGQLKIVVVEKTGGGQRRGAEQIERRQVAENADDVREDDDDAAAVATRHPPTSGPHAAAAVRPARVQVALQGVEGGDVAHARRRHDQPRADEAERRYQPGAVHLPIKNQSTPLGLPVRVR